ncbi:MAG: tRNA1(Val) (adenine(37)-N6)-methyltransferase [Ruminococcaceae bacterium]|nr:tRNA1(Val) (adenine(37)-N6)-methyltransferase [Oscillospiraceae bacterium]
MIKEFETLEDLGDGYKILQKEDGFKFGTDAVLLADFANIKPNDTVMDLCTGTGIIPLLLHQKIKPKHISALEIQEEIADMAQRTIRLNDLNGDISIMCGDLKNIKMLFTANSYTAVTCNPPYMVNMTGKKNINDSKTISRHEVMCTLEDVISCSSYLLGSGGRLFMVHRPERLVDIFYLMRNYRLEPKRLKLTGGKDEPALVLIEAQKDRKPGLKITGGKA